MEQEFEISVVLLTFNQSLESVELSINSVALQEDVSVELIISDDHSSIDQSHEVTNYLRKMGFQHFLYLRNQKNIGIVGNYLRGIEAAHGRYIKMLSPGDALYESRTLRSIVDFCNETDAKVGFGRLLAYNIDDNNRVRYFPYSAPRNPKKYNEDTVAVSDLLAEHIRHANWIPGCALFYERELIHHYLHQLYDEFKVEFSEDLSVSLMLSDGVRPLFFDRPVLWYELGAGISTGGSMQSRRRLYMDHRRYYERLMGLHVGERLYLDSYRWFALREFVALHTPIYRLLQRLRQRQYVSDSRTRNEPSGFFEQCRTVDTSEVE